MPRCISTKLIPALILITLSGTAIASGFQLLEQNSSGIGNAYAGSAAVAENASTIFFNPAGMTQLQAQEISGGLAGINPSFKFNDQGSSAGSLAGTGNGGNAGGWAVVPNGYLVLAITRDIYVGLGLTSPFGLRTEYDGRWLGAAQSTKFDIKTINLNPSMAYRISDKISLGVGGNWQQIKAEYARQTGITTGTSVVKSTMNLDDSAWGWNAGALFTLSSTTKLGLSYRSKVKYNTNGDVKLSSDGSIAGNSTLAALLAGGAPSNVEASLTLPDTFIMSVAQKLSSKWEMLGDVSRTGWSSIPKVDIMRSSGALNGQNAQTLGTDFRDAWRVALGANYNSTDAWKLKFGIAYDQTPVKGEGTRMTSLPDNNRIWYSFGTQWSPNKVSRLDLGLTYIHVRDSKIKNDQTTNQTIPRGAVSGEYTGNIWVVGGQYSISF